jgi:tetratricopeptide (TPR) repeat protein
LYRNVASRSKSPEATLVLAGFLGRRGRIREALDLCDRAWQTCAPEVVATASVMILYGAASDDGQHARVERRLEEATRKHPDRVSIQFDLANLRSLQGRYKEAEGIYRALSTQNKDSGGPLNNLAWMLALQGNKEKEKDALDSISRAIQLDGPTPDLLDTRALVFLAMGRADDAIRDLEDSAAVGPTSDKYLHLAQAYRMAGKVDEAGEALQKAKTLGLTMDKLHPLERENYRRLMGALAQK